MRIRNFVPTLICLATCVAVGAAAQEKEKPRQDKKAQKTADMLTLTGTIEKTVSERKRDDGTVLNVPSYTLIEASGNKVQLPAPRRRENGELLDKINLDEFVDKRVIVTGRGIAAKRSERPDAPVQAVKVIEITSIKLTK